LGATAGLSSSAAVRTKSQCSLLDKPVVAPNVYRWIDD
jgi:hypothetical protein